ncbi:hypothetical protein [Burkholderia plantarii]|uniref:hypothetical protein n=1 Tax=Burkholderia plantarii TaxID=41899 RepID=UPI001395FAFC|nr:hypothetical protein [Burkholderia plantarii]
MPAQVTGYATTVLPCQSPPIVFGNALAKLERRAARRDCLVTALPGFVLAVPANVRGGACRTGREPCRAEKGGSNGRRAAHARRHGAIQAPQKTIPSQSMRRNEWDDR